MELKLCVDSTIYFIFATYTSGTVFATLYFISNLSIRQVSYTVCPWQGFLAQYNVTF